MSKARRPQRLAARGEIYTFPLPGDRYGAMQILGPSAQHKSCTEIAVLDYLEPAPLTLPRQLRFLRWPVGYKANKPDCVNVQGPVPWWAVRVGELPILEEVTGPISTFAGWGAARSAYYLERRMRLGASPDTPRIAEPQTLTMDLGKGAQPVSQDVRSVEVFGDADIAGLDALPCLTSIRYTGSNLAVIDFVKKRLLAYLEWRDFAGPVLDLTDTTLPDLTLHIGSEPFTLQAPADLSGLYLSGRIENLTVRGIPGDLPFRLTLTARNLTPPPKGLEGCQSVEYRGFQDATGPQGYTRLAELTLRGPGTLSHFHALESLREIKIYDVYNLDAANWPEDWPHLDSATIRGLRKAELPRIKASLAKVPDVKITGARTDEWLEENANNPFRNWSEDEAGLGSGACRAWVKAWKARTSSAEEKTLHTLVKDLNKLDDKYGIDTLRREEAAEAFFLLAEEMSVDSGQAQAWFDAWRDF